MKTKFYISIILVILNIEFNYAQVPAAPQSKSILLLGGIAHIGTGQVIPNSAIGFKNGKIELVADATVIKFDKSQWEEIIDVSGKHVYPGIIAPNITLGLREMDAVRASNDYQESGSTNPNVHSLIAFNTDSRLIPTVRSNGILLTQATPRGGYISGTSSVMALDGWNWEDAVYKSDDGIHMNWPRLMVPTGWTDDGPTGWEKNKNYDKAVIAINKFFSDAKAYCEQTSVTEKNLRFEAMRGVYDGSRNLYVNASNVREITEALQFCVKAGVKKPVLVGGTDSYMVTDLLKQYNIPVILGRVHSLPARVDEDIDMPFKTPSLLKEAGILYCLSNEGDMEAMGARNLPFQAGTTAAYGLSKEEALMSITLNTAKILGIDKTYGSLEVGKDAILFVSTGDALDMKSNNIEQAFIRGAKVDLDNQQKQLYNKYKTKYGLK